MFTYKIYTVLTQIDQMITYVCEGDNYGFQSYLEKVKIVEHRTTLTRLRTGCTYLALDVGRFENIPRENRICPLCKSGVEDANTFIRVQV